MDATEPARAGGSLGEAYQLPLPLAAPPPESSPTRPLALPPGQVWASLTPAQRRQVRRILVRICQEVSHDGPDSAGR
jgi:hypothetical protein